MTLEPAKSEPFRLNDVIERAAGNGTDTTRGAFSEELLATFDADVRRRKTGPSEQSLDFEGGKITLRSEGGKPVYFKDGAEEWDSKDGELWIRRGTDGLGSWRGKISFDKTGNLVEEGLSYGLKNTRRADGSSTSSITTEKGDVISLTTRADGTSEFNGTSGTWTSKDGATWKNGDKTYHGKLGIDVFGRYWRQPAGSDNKDFAERSAENRAIVDKMSSMEGTYNISFGRAGNPSQYEYRDADKDKYVKVTVNYRFPTLSELNILDKSLQQYGHLSKPGDKPDFNGLRINFISPAGEGTKAGEYGWYNSRLAGISQITFAPRNLLQDTAAWEGLRGTALHEIAHHLQHKLWDKGAGKESPQAVLDAFGFKHHAASGNYRLEDKDGGLWELHETRQRDKDTGKWGYRSRWYPVVKDTVLKEETRSRTAQQMHDSLPADRKPCTNYFTNPAEAHAEALSMYLFDRRMLFERNSKLYDSTKKWDQDDIDKRYGADKMMRGADGYIVPINADNRRKVQDMEGGWKKKAASLVEMLQWQAAIERRDQAAEHF